MQSNLIVVLATLATAHAQLTGVNSFVTPPLEKYLYQKTTASNVITYSDGIFVQDTFSNSPVACNGNWVKSDVQIYKKGTCYDIPPVTNGKAPTSQAVEICNFAYTTTTFQNPSSPAYVPFGNTAAAGYTYNYVNDITKGCSYTMSLDVANCNNVLIQPFYGQGCKTRVGLLQYQTTLVQGTYPSPYSTVPSFASWYGASTYPSSAFSGTDCSLTNTANMNVLNAAPLGVCSSSGTCTVTTAVSSIYSCGYPQAIKPSPIGYLSGAIPATSNCQDGSSSCICAKGVSSRCVYNMAQVYSGSSANVLVMSSWDNNLGSGCSGNITEAQIVSTGTCFLSGHLTSGNNPNNYIKGNGNKLTQPFVKATVGSGGNTYNLNYYHTQINCLADSNAVETFDGQLNTCLTEDDHPAYDDVALPKSSTSFPYGPNNVVGTANRIYVSYYPSTNSCNNNDDDNYCSITSGGIAGIVIAVVFVVFLLLVILFMCIRYCGKAPPSGPAPTAAASQSKGGEGNPLLAGSV